MDFMTIILISVLFYGFQSYILIMYKALCVSAQAHLQQLWTFNQVAIRNSHCIQSKVSSALGRLTRKIFLFSFFFICPKHYLSACMVKLYKILQLINNCFQSITLIRTNAFQNRLRIFILIRFFNKILSRFQRCKFWLLQSTKEYRKRFMLFRKNRCNVI